MSSNPSSTEWAGSRGQKWLSHLSAMEAMLAPINAPLIAALGLDKPYAIADIGCGGGATSLEIHRQMAKGSTVHGFDISSELIAEARSKILAGDTSIAFHVTDVAITPPKQLYDRLTSRFGIMFFDKPEAAFANIAKWLKPGGRFAFAVWGEVAENPWMTIVRDAVAEVTIVPKTDPTGPGAFRYAQVETLKSLLENSGFSDSTVTEWRGEIPVGGGLASGAAAEFAISAFASFADLLKKAGNNAYTKATEILAQQFAEKEHDGIVQLKAFVHIVSGKRND